MLTPFVTQAQPTEEYSNLQFNPLNAPHPSDQGHVQQGFPPQDPTQAQMNGYAQGNQPQELDPYATAQPFLDPSVPSDAIRSNFSKLNYSLK
jgi:hypothetical protein